MNAAAAVEPFPESGGSQLLRAALHESMRMGREAGELSPTQEAHVEPGELREVRLAGETMSALLDEIRASSRIAAKEAVQGMLTEENARTFFKIGATVVREEFTLHAGEWLLGGVWAGIKNAMWVALFLGLAIWFVGPKVLGIVASAVFSKDGAR